MARQFLHLNATVTPEMVRKKGRKIMEYKVIVIECVQLILSLEVLLEICQKTVQNMEE